MRKAHSLLFSATVALAPVLLLSGTAAQTQAPAATAKTVLTQALPDLRGKEVLMLTVEYQPGGISPSHRHNANTFVYVLEGSIVMAVAGGKETTLSVGQTFYESPTDIHSVSRNASKTQPAKFLVFHAQGAGRACYRAHLGIKGHEDSRYLTRMVHLTCPRVSRARCRLRSPPRQPAP